MILHLIETGGPGGAEQMLLRLADEYARRGLPQVVCLRKEGWLAGEVRRRKIPLKIRPLMGLPDLGWLMDLREWGKGQGVTAIHAHEFAMNVRGALLGRWLKVPAVATVHGLGYFGDRFARRALYRLCSRFARFVAVSEDIRKALIAKGGVHPNRVSVIPNGVDIKRFNFDENRRRSMRSNLGISDSQILLGSIGSYYPVKGQKYLIDAVAKMVKDHPNIRLVLAGQGALEQDLRRRAADLGLAEVVNVAGYIEDTPGLLSALDVFILPSLSEGQPLALLEAAANGRSIVATDVGGVSEIITSGETGLLVPPANTAALACAIGEIITKAELRSNLANSAALMIRERWSIERTADHYLDLLRPGLSKGTLAFRGGGIR